MIKVAVGVIVNALGEVLVALRPDDRPLAGYWEFPGGKLEEGENTFQALQRELQEELGITVHQASPFLQQQHRYTHDEVLLDVWRVDSYSGEPVGCEGQRIEWCVPLMLEQLKFPPANQVIIQQLSNHPNL